MKVILTLPDELADQIHKEYMAWFREEIEKLENPYSKYACGDEHETGFESCRKKILKTLEGK